MLFQVKALGFSTARFCKYERDLASERTAAKYRSTLVFPIIHSMLERVWTECTMLIVEVAAVAMFEF